MGEMVWIALFYQIPEGVMITLFGLGLFGVVRHRHRVIWVGFLYGLAIPLLRTAGVSYIFRPLILCVFFVVLVTWLLDVRILTAISAWTVAQVPLAVGEQFVAGNILTHLQLDVTATLGSPMLHILWGWVAASPLLIATLLVTRKRFVLIPIPDQENARRGG